jgi:hypothetical protein
MNTNLTIPTDDGRTTTYTLADSLAEKVNSPVPKGGQETGVVIFAFTDLPDYSVVEKGAAVEFKFFDVNDKEYACRMITDGRNSHGVEIMPGLKH